jgi:uncharacterized protein (TIGR03066 family)
MRLATALLAIVFGATLDQPASAADNKDKIVGQWKIIKGEEVPAGTMIEFTKTGKVVFHIDLNGKSMSIEVGDYKIDGDKLTLTAKKGEKDDTEVNTIKSLTDDKLVLVDPKKKEVELERVKKK